VPYDCSVELSPLGNQFLTDIFEAYDKVSPRSRNSPETSRIRTVRCRNLSWMICFRLHLGTPGLRRDSRIRRSRMIWAG
jgi:hypothetical protein